MRVVLRVRRIKNLSMNCFFFFLNTRNGCFIVNVAVRRLAIQRKQLVVWKSISVSVFFLLFFFQSNGSLCFRLNEFEWILSLIVSRVVHWMVFLAKVNRIFINDFVRPNIQDSRKFERANLEATRNAFGDLSCPIWKEKREMKNYSYLEAIRR